uniref:Putative longitudinals lacking protein isoform a/b/d/l-like isoform x3 n=1 Tax=Xenopsylla cheopis TaxID=163159 RepID=A0A6M2DUY3_XENCH
MEDDQQFCLKWNNHQSTLISQFDTLLENETLVDCTLAAEGKYLRAHKVVLSACSPYFESLLRLQYDKHPIFILKDVKYQELRAMIDYMYRGQVNISQDQLGALLKAAETLQIKGLSDSRTNEKKQPERVPSPPLPSSTKSSGPTISKPIVKPPPPDDDIADQSSPADRETSSSPTSRKRRRSRRHSNDESAVLPDNHELSNSSTHSEFVSHLSAQSSINRPSITDRTENSTDTFQSPAIAKTTEKLNVPKVKEIRKSEQHSELILEPKSEYVDEEGNDSVEDLTLEDEDMDDMDQSQAGPSHGGEGSSQGFAGWHNMGGDRTQDEVFMAAQDAAAGHRDSQDGSAFGSADLFWFQDLDCVNGVVVMNDSNNHDRKLSLNNHHTKRSNNNNIERKPPPLLFHSSVSKLNSSTTITPLCDKKLKSEPKSSNQEVRIYADGKWQNNNDSERGDLPRYWCEKCGRIYSNRNNLQRHCRYECGTDHSAFKCPYCPHSSRRKDNLKTHIVKKHNPNYAG